MKTVTTIYTCNNCEKTCTTLFTFGTITFLQSKDGKGQSHISLEPRARGTSNPDFCSENCAREWFLQRTEVRFGDDRVTPVVGK